LKHIKGIFLVILLFVIVSACSTTKKKSEVKGLKKLYHNTTAKYNGYFNAEELMDEGVVSLQEMHQDNYNTVLDVYDYVNVEGATSINADMDKAIEKLTTVATIHDVSNYLDDCYVLIGKAQYLKQDYASAEETFQYFDEEFDPKNPYGRVYKANNKKKSGKAARKEKAQERKEKDKERKEIRKEQEEKREEEKKTREQKQKERKKAAKEKKKQRKKSGKRGERTSSKKEETKVKTEAEKSAEEAKKLIEEQNKKAIEDAKKAKELEEKKKEEKKKEEKKYAREGEGAIFVNRTAYTNGLYWLARTYIERERFSTAEYVINKLESTAGLSDKIGNKLPAAKAHLFLKTKDYPRALVELEEALSKEKNKRKRSRYAFIKAQLYEMMDNPAMAYEEYKRAKKLNPEYELRLNAEMNEIKLAHKQGQLSREKVISKLEKMLADRKNERLKDQLYFAIAQVKLDAGEVDAAVEDFKLAISESSGNKNISLEANYKLGNLLFEKGIYRDSKTHYDNVLALMSKQDERYRQVEKLSKNLTEIAGNIDVINLQDSLLRMSMLSESELKDVAIEILKEKDLQKLQVKEDLQNRDIRSNVRVSNKALGASRSNFFAYNPSALNQGKIEFERVWSDRVLENNWRRSLRADVSSVFIDEDNQESIEDKEYSEDEIMGILKDIPRNDAQKQSAHLRIQNALFDLGVLFRDRIRDYGKSVEVLERLIREYPNFEKRDEALFYLYLSYKDLPNATKANEILQKMAAEYPESKFTKLATDPNYAESLRNNEGSIGSFYDKTYVMFEQSNYQGVIDRCDERKERFPGKKDFAAKFDLLRAMSYGSLEGKERYVKELQQVIRAHPRSDEESRAKEILRFLNGDQQAFDEILYEEDVDVFETDDAKLHYVFIVTYGLSQKEFDLYKKDISNYNKKYHRFENLKLSNIYLNIEEKSRVILVRSFKDKDKSMIYYKGAKDNKKEFVKNTDKEYDVFVATQKNYREVIKQKSTKGYQLFFENNYTKK